MTTLQKKDIDHIAHLAKLTIAPEEYDPLLKKLNNTLKIVEKMNSVNTDQVAPMAHPYEEQQPLRADEITETNQRQLFQTLAPKTEAGLYIVPSVIDNE